MDLRRMLEKCDRDQWKVGDLDWSRPPRAMPKDDEIAVVQYFTDMAGIERLAAALFNEQRKLVQDPTLRSIFETFVVDEIRHAQAAEMLADYYDVHRYQKYEMNPDLVGFTPHFVNAVRHLSAEIANAYITCGELILDVALLRSLNDFVADGMSQQAMDLINRDESRHIAIDFYMCAFYASAEYAEIREAEPTKGPVERAKALWAFANVLYHAGPFFRSVFFEPMDLTDPSGRRIKEAFKRIQLIAARPGVGARPFVRFMETLRRGYNRPLVRRAMGGLIARITGLEPRVLETLYSAKEAERARGMTWDELAEDALAAKLSA